MKSRDFVYWFQGFLEVGNPEEINNRTVEKKVGMFPSVFRSTNLHISLRTG